MKEEISKLIRQAEADIRTAKNSLNSEDYYASIFWCQQAIEKALKSVLMQDRGELIKTHSVIRLGKEALLPDNLLEKLPFFEPIYQETRYPELSDKIPSEEFKVDKATDAVIICQEVVEWVRKKLR